MLLPLKFCSLVLTGFVEVAVKSVSWYVSIVARVEPQQTSTRLTHVSRKVRIDACTKCRTGRSIVFFSSKLQSEPDYLTYTFMLSESLTDVL